MFVFAPSLFLEECEQALDLILFAVTSRNTAAPGFEEKKAMQISRLTRPLECISRKQAPKYIRITN